MEFVPLERDSKELSLCLLPCGDTARRWSSVNQEAGPQQTLNLPDLDWTSQPPELGEKGLLCDNIAPSRWYFGYSRLSRLRQ